MMRQADVEKVLVALEMMTAERLRDRFEEVYRRPSPRHLSRDLLVRSIAFRLQERSSRSFDRALDAHLRKLVITLCETGEIDIGQGPTNIAFLGRTKTNPPLQARLTPASTRSKPGPPNGPREQIARMAAERLSVAVSSVRSGAA